MQSIRSAVLTIIAHLSKLLTGFLVLKLVSYYLGPEGLGRLGHLMTLVTLLSVIAGGGIINGIIKYVAEYKTNKNLLIEFVYAAKLYSSLFSILVAIVILLLSSKISQFVFDDAKYYSWIMLVAISQVLLAYSNLVIGVYNGLGKSYAYAIIQGSGFILSIPLCWVLISKLHFFGAVLSLALVMCVSFFPAVVFGLKLKLHTPKKNITRAYFHQKKLFHFTLMLLVSAVIFPLSETLIRQEIIDIGGYWEAGQWQAAIRLTSAFTGLFSVCFAFWFMPIISATNDWHKIKSFTFKVMAGGMLLHLLGALTLVTFAKQLIPLLLSNEFIYVENIIMYQLIGDFFKVGAYVIGFVAVAKAATKTYIAAEFIQNIVYVALALMLISSFSRAEGAMIGYAITYFLYFLTSGLVFLYIVKRRNTIIQVGS